MNIIKREDVLPYTKQLQIDCFQEKYKATREKLNPHIISAGHLWFHNKRPEIPNNTLFFLKMNTMLGKSL